MKIKSYLKNTYLITKMLDFLQPLLCGMLGGLIILAFFNNHNSLSIATVNITGLVDRFIKEESQKNLPPDKLKNEVSRFGNQLEQVLKVHAKDTHKVLLPSEAVITGTDDDTAIISQKILGFR